MEINKEELSGYDTNPELFGLVEPDTDLKNMLVEYVGSELNPENKEVTVEMIIEVVAREFPEFVLALAEENFFRGYKQGISDIHSGTNEINKQLEAIKKLDEKRKTCKICEK